MAAQKSIHTQEELEKLVKELFLTLPDFTENHD